MDIKETFISLTRRTYPHGTEDDLFKFLPQDLDIDEFGNLYKEIGIKPSTMFTSHLDTATASLSEITHVFDNNIIRTDNTSILGADDKAGVTIMLHMIKNKVPGLYYFFLGEEVGCIGSKKLADLHKSKPIEYIKKVISFDRRGYDSIITHQCSSRCCSDEFGNYLSSELNKHGFNYKNDPTGLYTDSAQFTKIYPECTNISVGYQNEHTYNEYQDIDHLINLCNAVTLIDWEKMPIKRDATVNEYLYEDYGSGWGTWSPYGYEFTKSVTSSPSIDKEYERVIYFTDEEYDDDENDSYIKLLNKEVEKIKISDHRINYEIDLITEFLESIEIEFDVIHWDGYNLTVTYDLSKGGHETVCNRNDMSPFIPELDFWEEYIYYA